MTDFARTDRRSFIAGVSAAALLPLPSMAQGGAVSFAAFDARCRALTGFDPVPRPLVEAAMAQLDDLEARAFAEGHDAAEDTGKAVLMTLYTGMHSPENGEPERVAYAQALMYAAIEDTVNVPSYCGGLPGYWAEKPADV